MGVKTIQVLEAREKNLLLDDATTHMGCRLGLASDFLEEDLVEAMGIWFKALHSKPVKALVEKLERGE